MAASTPTLYASVDDFKQLALAQQTLASVSDAEVAKALATASARAASYLGQRFLLPLVAWGADLVDAVCALAAWRILCRRGFNPEGHGDSAIRMSYDDAITWLRAVAEGSAQPDGLVPAPPPAADDWGAAVVTERLRGW